MEITPILEAMVEAGGSDLLLKPGAPPAVKVSGQVRLLSDEPVQESDNRAFFERYSTEHARKRLAQDFETDVAMEFEGIGRFRANVFYQRGQLSMVLRRILTQVGTFEDLLLPEAPLKHLAGAQRGLVLVTGVAGSGKSTTLASMIEYVNQQSARHIVTIEDPIEYLYKDKRSVIQQRELGLDTESYASALKHVVRQAPDVILIGEMRDLETMSAALSAAETGHLVLSTLHTVNAPQTVERIISFFPPHQHPLIRVQLSMLLKGVVSLRLVPRQDGRGRVPAAEVMVWTPTIRELLEEGKTYDLHKAVEGGEFHGMQTFNKSLAGWIRRGMVTLEEALLASDDPDGLRLQMRGIRKGV